MKTITALLLCALALSAEGTVTCAGCTDYGVIAGTEYTASYGKKMVWTLTGFDPGIYCVDLVFVEPIWNSAGKRPMTVTVATNGVPVVVLRAFDIFAAVGFAKPATRSTLVVVSDGKIVITLTNDLGNSAILSGIKVRPLLDM